MVQLGRRGADQHDKPHHEYEEDKELTQYQVKKFDNYRTPNGDGNNLPVGPLVGRKALCVDDLDERDHVQDIDYQVGHL